MPLHSGAPPRAHARRPGHAHRRQSTIFPARHARQAEHSGTRAHARAARSWQRRVREWVTVFALAALAAFVLHTYVVETFLVPSGSMYPTLQVGDRMLADRLPFALHDLHTGDIVVFHRVPADTDPTQPAYLVKRVIGLPGQTISSRGGTVLIDNKPLREPWLPNLAKLPAKWLCNEAAENIPKTVIPPSHYFVMGDCRGNSYDSRAWGTVPASAVVGKVFTVIWRANHPWFHWF